MKSLFRPLLAVVATAWLVLSPSASAEPVGFGTVGPPLTTTHLFDPGHPGWVIGSPTAPIGITAVPENAPWLKQLEVPTFFQFSTVLTVTEHLVVGQPGSLGPAWTDWHEHILNSQWDWVSGQIIVGGVVVSTGELGVPPGDHSSNIWFDFNPLQPGTELTIVKQIHCHVDPGCGPQIPIQIVEYPTIRVPEPATLALLGAGLLGAVGLRTRRTRRAA